MRILLIEDSKAHAQDARIILEAAGHTVFHEKDMDYFWRYTPDEHDGAPAEVPVDGAILDVHFPLSAQRGGDQDYTSPEYPVGILAGARCVKAGIPFVLCTDSYHHANKLEWIHQLVHYLDWKMVDVYMDSYTGVAPRKNWEAALRILLGAEED